MSRASKWLELLDAEPTNPDAGDAVFRAVARCRADARAFETAFDDMLHELGAEHTAQLEHLEAERRAIAGEQGSLTATHVETLVEFLACAFPGGVDVEVEEVLRQHQGLLKQLGISVAWLRDKDRRGSPP